MMITAHFHGILADWVGTPLAVFELPAGAYATSMLAAIAVVVETDDTPCP